MPSMSRPDNLGAGGTKLGSGVNGGPDVVIGDVAEDAAEQDQIRGHGSLILVASRGISLADLHLRIDQRGRLLCPVSQPGVVLDEKR